MDRRVLWHGFVVSIIVLLCLGASVVAAQSPEEEEGHGIPFHLQIVDPEAIPRGTCATLFWETPIEQDWPVFLDGKHSNESDKRSAGMDDDGFPEEF